MNSYPFARNFSELPICFWILVSVNLVIWWEIWVSYLFLRAQYRLNVVFIYVNWLSFLSSLFCECLDYLWWCQLWHCTTDMHVMKWIQIGNFVWWRRLICVCWFRVLGRLIGHKPWNGIAEQYGSAAIVTAQSPANFVGQYPLLFFPALCKSMYGRIVKNKTVYLVSLYLCSMNLWYLNCLCVVFILFSVFLNFWKWGVFS